MRRDRVTFCDIADEFDDGIDLLLGEGLIAAVAIPRVTTIDDLDPDRARVELGLTKPAAASGMPSQPTLIDQAVDRGWFDVDEIVAADPAPSQNLERVAEIQVRVVQHDEACTAFVVQALIAGVDARFLEGCHTTRQNQQRSEYDQGQVFGTGR